METVILINKSTAWLPIYYNQQDFYQKSGSNNAEY